MLVIKGFAKKEEIDYEEAFTLAMKTRTIHLVLSMATQFGWKLYQMDAKSAFFKGDLSEEIYMYRLHSI
jgi:hypothetical protein